MRRLARDVMLMASATAMSRVLGLFRDVTIADGFGAGAAYDAFLVAFFVPHFLRQLLAEGALSTAMIPIYGGLLASAGEGRPRDADAFASNLMSWLLIIFPLLVGLGMWFAKWYVPFLASGFSDEKLALTIALTRLVLPFIGIIGMAAVVMGILNAHRRFFIASLAPMWFNAGMLVGILVVAPRVQPPILGVGIGVLVGGIAQLGSQLPSLARLGFQFRFHLLPLHPGIRRLVRLMAPAFLTLAVTQVNLMVDNKLASHLGDGGISALQYAMRLFQLPLGVLAVSVATALLPRFSESWSQGDKDGFSRYLNQGLVISALVLLPAMVGLIVIGRDVIGLLFEHGSFTYTDTVRTSRVLFYYLIGLVPYGWVYVLTRASYSRAAPLFPLLASTVAVGVNVGLDLWLITRMGEAGLALATAVAGTCNAGLLGAILLRSSRLSRRTLTQLGWIALGGAGLFAVATGVRWALRTSPLWLMVMGPALVGMAYYGIFIRMTPLWRLVFAFRRR